MVYRPATEEEVEYIQKNGKHRIIVFGAGKRISPIFGEVDKPATSIVVDEEDKDFYMVYDTGTGDPDPDHGGGIPMRLDFIYKGKVGHIGVYCDLSTLENGKTHMAYNVVEYSYRIADKEQKRMAREKVFKGLISYEKHLDKHDQIQEFSIYSYRVREWDNFE